MGLPRCSHRLVGLSDLLHRGDESDGGHADAAPLLGDQDAEEAQASHLAEQVGRTTRLFPSHRSTGRDLLLCELAAQVDKHPFGFGEREVHEPILLFRPVQHRIGHSSYLCPS